MEQLKVNPWLEDIPSSRKKSILIKKPLIIRAWYPLLRFYQFVGLLPFRFTRVEPYVRYKIADWATFCCSALVVLFAFTFSVSFFMFIDSVTQPRTTRIVVCSQNVVYYSHCCFSAAFFVVCGPRVVRFFQQWILAERCLSQLMTREKDLLIKCWTTQIATVFMLFADNVFYILSQTLTDAESWSQALENIADDHSVHRFFGEYSYLYGTLLVFSETLAQGAWVLGDVFVILSSVVLKHYYSRLNERIRLANPVSSDGIEDLRKTHLLVSGLADAVNETFAPLILYCFASNVIYFLSVVHSGLANDMADPNIFIRISCAFTFIFLLLRIVVASYTAAQLAEEAQKTVEYISEWSSFDNPERPSEPESRLRILLMDRFIQQISTQPVSLGGGGFFAFNKTFIASVFSVIVTYEVIMLQLPR